WIKIVKDQYCRIEHSKLGLLRPHLDKTLPKYYLKNIMEVFCKGFSNKYKTFLRLHDLASAASHYESLYRGNAELGRLSAKCHTKVSSCSNFLFINFVDNKLWFQPECTGSGSEGQTAPSPRAFHIAIAIDCHMFVFGGRLGTKRLGDFWVLDTDIWQWSELTSFGDLPSPRDFAAASAIGNQKIVMSELLQKLFSHNLFFGLCYTIILVKLKCLAIGMADGMVKSGYLTYLYWIQVKILPLKSYPFSFMSLEWTELAVSGTLPPPRCGHTATMVEKRLLVYGGRGEIRGGGPIMGDLWALKGLIEEDTEVPGWTLLKLPGQAPAARCGHTVTSGGHYLLMFGGHGTGGWLSRYDVYYNDCVVLDRGECFT
ncbi:hypothetical protein M8C21_012051, partial [Ambrosia artemisiifolia]